MDVLHEFEQLPSSRALATMEVQEKILAKVEKRYKPSKLEFESLTDVPDIQTIVKEATAVYIAGSIDIPRIVVLPKGDLTCGFNEFDLDLRGVNLQPVSRDILIHRLRTNERERLHNNDTLVREECLEDYIVRSFIDFDDISYDDHSELLYKLAGQIVKHLRTYLPDADAVLNVLMYHHRQLAELAHAQMQGHYWESAADYDVHISKGFITLRPNNYAPATGERRKDFRSPVAEPSRIKRMTFSGFKRCLYSEQKFDSDSERRFAVLLEDESSGLKWFKPGPGVFQIHYSDDQNYEPDFVVETDKFKYICEPKRANEIKDDVVQLKAKAAVKWCKMATKHEERYGGKPWMYLLIPHDVITASATLEGLTILYQIH